jgi:ubiquinone/menaquinone biosynthesis C-methylase UbiE
MYIEKSYQAHKEHFKNLFEKEGERRLIPNEIDLKPLEALKPFFLQKKKWLTIGDYNGTEANYIKNHNQEVTASNITDVFLEEAFKRGLIDNFSEQNAESLTFEDGEYDYIMMKETYHHLPRPYLAIYDMLRVCRKAVIIVAEPIDILSKMSSLVFIKNFLDKINPVLINKIWKNRISYEHFSSDDKVNYVYKISEREIEKLAAALILPLVAFKSVNVNSNRIYRILSFLKIIPKNSLTCIIFKEFPSDEVLKAMKQSKYKIILNTYCKSINSVT